MSEDELFCHICGKPIYFSHGINENWMHCKCGDKYLGADVV